MKKACNQKHLGILVNFRLDFQEHWKPQSNYQYRTKNAQNIPHNNVKHQFFKNSYFPLNIIEWNRLNSNIHNSETLNLC